MNEARPWATVQAELVEALNGLDPAVQTRLASCFDDVVGVPGRATLSDRTASDP